MIEDPDWENAAPNCIGNTADVVTGMAVKKLVGYKRTKFDLHPPNTREQIAKRQFPKSPEELASYFENTNASPFLKHRGQVVIHRDHNKEQHNLHGNTDLSAATLKRKHEASPQGLCPQEEQLRGKRSCREENGGGASSTSPTDFSMRANEEVRPIDVLQTQGAVILDFKNYCIRSVRPFANDTDGELVTMTCGPRIENTRNRSEVIVECGGGAADDDLRDAYEKLKQKGGGAILGITVSKFRNGVAALIIKDKNKNVKFEGCTKALELGRRSNETVIAQARSFSTAVQSYGDMVMEKKRVDNEIPDFAEACDQLSAFDSAGFRELHANALKAKRYDRLTPLQDAVLTYTTDLKEWLACKEDAESMIFHMNNPGPHFLDNFKRNTVLNLRGVHYEVSSGIQVTTLKDAISRPQGPGKPPLCHAKTLIFVGKPSTGKSEFVHGLCREFCQRHKKDKYAMSGSIDPYGLMTKTGKMKELGAVGLYDFEMKSKINSRLSREEAKGLLYVKERAHIGARYHQAVFYEFVPRIWAINMGHDQKGEDDPSEWFRNEHLEGLAMLAQEDAAGLQRINGHDQATARRAVIFVVGECLFESDAQGATDALAVAYSNEGMCNATPLD